MKDILILFYEFLICLFLIFYEIFKSSFSFINQFLLPKYKSIRNEIVLLTGAASGIGRLMCVKLAAKGCIVIGVDVDQDGLLKTKSIVKEETNKDMFTYVCDIRFKDNILKLRTYIEENVGYVDILINNAGIVHGKKILDLSVDDIKETFDVNIFSNFYAVQEFLPKMIERSHGHIVIVSSMAGFTTAPFLSDYCSSKAASIMFAESLLSELRYLYNDFNIGVTTVTPFLIKTGMFSGCSSRLKFILPDLEPCYVADKIVESIMKNQIHLSIGRMVYFIAVVKSILPFNAVFELYKFTGAISFLKTFIDIRGAGRNKCYKKSE